MKTTIHKFNLNVDVPLVLMDSGQVFHWRAAGDCAAEDCAAADCRTAGGFVAVVEGRAALVYGIEGGLAVVEDHNASIDQEEGRAFWARYFDVARDYGAVCESYGRVAQVARAMEALPGLRVLNQPPWEALIAFILSANNNVGRIRRLVHALCREIGMRYEVAGAAVYGFPEPAALAAAGEDFLRALGVGYRAPYLVRSARMVAEGFALDGLGALPYETAHQRLMELPGVGPKVADCVLLFGCGHAEALPVDVWMERVLQGQFGLVGTRAQLKRQGMALLGDMAGLAQQFLFHAARTGSGN